MKGDGFTNLEIAREFGVSEKRVRQMVSRGRELAEVDNFDRDAIRGDRVASLGQTLQSVALLAHQGDLKATEIYIKLLDREAKYLGLDAPAKTEQKSESKVLIIDEELAGVL